MLPEKVQKALDYAAHPSFWGSISIVYQNGQAVIVKTERTEKLYPQENHRHEQYR